MKRPLSLKKKFPGLTGTKSSAILFAIVFAAVGGLLVVLTRAATPTANFEAEAGSRSGNVTQVADATASGGSAVKFGTPAPASACTTKPDASNTGTTGTLTADSRTVLSTANEVVQNRIFANNIVIQADGIQLKNVRVNGNIVINESDNILFDRVKAVGVAISSSADVTIQYAHVTGFEDDAFHFTSDGSSQIRNVTLRYSYIDRPGFFTPDSEAHWDGLQMRGVNGVNIFCNNFDAGPWQFPYNVLIYSEPTNGGNYNIYVDNNWLNGGNFAFMGGTSVPTGFEITNNKLLSADFYFGLCYPGGAFTRDNIDQMVQTGNTLDGAPITQVCKASDF